MSATIHGSVSLGHEIILFPVTSEIIDVLQHPAVMNLAVRRFDKAEFVDARESRHRTNEADVRPFRRLDRTNPPVMRRMDVTHFKARTIPAQAAWPKCGQTTLVRQLRQRIRLIHELRKL